MMGASDDAVRVLQDAYADPGVLSLVMPDGRPLAQWLDDEARISAMTARLAAAYRSPDCPNGEFWDAVAALARLEENRG